MNNFKILTAIFFIAVSLFVIQLDADANVTMPSHFGDHMVLQQNSEIKLWGWGRPQEPITVVASWGNDSVKAIVNNQCNWSVTLSTPVAGGPYNISIQGNNQISISDVLIGEVWLLAGQSNMEWSADWGFNNSDEEVKKANHPNIRLFSVSHRASKSTCLNVDGEWMACTPESMKKFSAIGYIFGRCLQDSLNVPVGLINTSWGGSPIEIWMPEEKITNNNTLLEASKKIKEMEWSPREPGRAYNAMIAPLMPTNIAGVLWYQGETNASNPLTYTKMLSTLVSSWRDGFQKEFPFYYAQIAPWNGYDEVAGAKVREAQRRALDKVRNSGMVVVSDIGDTTDIHPRNKIDAGIRFANLALNKTYGKSNLASSGPLYESFKVEGKKVVVKFKNAEGLYVNGSALKLFEIQDKEGGWYPAKAKIKDNKVVVYSSKVKAPVAVRFAWRNSATPGLFNNYNLPASCFNTNIQMD